MRTAGRPVRLEHGEHARRHPRWPVGGVRLSRSHSSVTRTSPRLMSRGRTPIRPSGTIRKWSTPKSR